MATIEFFVPFWGNVEVKTSQDLYDTIELARKHSIEKKMDHFSRVHTTSYLLVTVALSFFQAFSFGAKALSDGALCYYENKTDEATEALYNYGTGALKHLVFTVYLLGLTVWALAFPSDVNEMLTLHEPLVLKPGIFSKDPEDPTNLLMFQNEALRRQGVLLQSEPSSKVLNELLVRNETCETRIEDVRFRANQEVEFAQTAAADSKKEVKRLTALIAQQKTDHEECIQSLKTQIEQKKRFWEYIKKSLQGEWKSLCGEALINKIEYVEGTPHIYRRRGI